MKKIDYGQQGELIIYNKYNSAMILKHLHIRTVHYALFFIVQ